jgi:hypothetical protein
MTIQPWSIGLAAAGLITLPSLARAEEQLSPVLTALSSTTISGYVNTSAQWNPGTGNANPPAVVFNRDKQDGFNLDVVKLSIERAPQEAQWSAGYKVDLWLGPDANTLGTQSSLNQGDFAVKQAYVDLKTPIHNGIDFKLGVWDTIMGYEVADGPNNPNYTRSYGFTLEPVTHTGLLATWQLSSMLTLAAGVSDTFGPQINARAHPLADLALSGPKAESYKTYMGSVTFTAPDSFGFLKGSTLTACAMNGFDKFAPRDGIGSGPADQTSLYAGGAINTPITKLKIGVAFDYVSINEQPLTANTETYASAYGLYVLYQLTEKLAFNARGEYAQSDTAIVGPTKVFEATGTLQYDLWKNVLTRLEFRWDHAAAGADAFGGSTAGAAPNARNAYMLAANVAYRF